MGFRDHGLAAIFLLLACLLSSLAGRVVLRLNRSYPSLIHLALFLSTCCLISMSFVFTSENGPGSALTTCGAFWSVCSESSRKMIGCRPRSPPRMLKSRPSCLPLISNTDCHETSCAGSHMWNGVTAARDQYCSLFTGSHHLSSVELLGCDSGVWLLVSLTTS